MTPSELVSFMFKTKHMQILKYMGQLSLVLASTLVCQIALATNGYFPHGLGTKNKAMAGAGMAMPEDAIAVVNNPAVAAFLGDKMNVGLSFFIPRRSYTTFEAGSNGENNAFTMGPADIDSGDDLYVIPEIALNRQLENNSAFAIAFYMRAGIGTSYVGGSATFDPDGGGPLGVSSSPGTFGDGDTKFELSQGFLDIAWARQWGERTSFGVSAVLAAQSLKVAGLGGLAKYTQTFAASNSTDLPDNLSGNGRDLNYGVGIKLGLHRLVGMHYSFGLMFQSEINIGSSGDYTDLLVGGDLDIPAWFRAGLSWLPNDRFSLHFDTQQILYSKIDALANSFSNINACPTSGLGGTDLSSCLGGSKGPGFGWKDVPVYSLGSSWKMSDKWTLLAGISISNQPTPINENSFNTLLINTTETHYTAGFSRKLGNGHELNLAFMYTEEESIEHPSQLDGVQRSLLTSDQFDIQLGYSW